MPYILRRVSDGAGDSGPLCQFFKYKVEGGQLFKDYIKSEVPVVGASVLVGSLFTRTYSRQDYWQTTEVTEIIEDEIRHDDEGDEYRYVRFKTLNSEYEWMDL